MWWVVEGMGRKNDLEIDAMAPLIRRKRFPFSSS
jgi:hypothetical protein